MEQEPRWFEQRIIVDPTILVGKPVVKGTRIPVYLVLERLANDLDLDALFAAFPSLTLEDVRACLAYGAALVEGEDVFPLFPEMAVGLTQMRGGGTRDETDRSGSHAG